MIETAGMRVISNEDCRKRFRYLFMTQSNFQWNYCIICTENPAKQTESCKGSTGAPLMYTYDSKQWIAIGIESNRYSCGIHAPRVVTRVSPYLDWITDNMNIGENKDCGLQNTNEGFWPWMVAITKYERGGYFRILCNGFLIDDTHVLTVAHCFDEKYDLNDFLIRIGFENWRHGDPFMITCIKKHHRYETGQHYDDIAILTLSRSVYSRNYAPICIPDDNLRIKNMSGVEVTKISWGALEFGGNISETLIQNKGLRILSNKDCHEAYGKLLGRLFLKQLPGGVSGDMVCTVNPTEQTETCGGDAGSPLMYRDKSNKWTAVGVAAFGLSCGVAPTVYTKVSAYLEWIARNTKDDKGHCIYIEI